MKELIRNKDRKVKQYILSISDSYKEDTRDFINFLDKQGYSFSLQGLKAYEKELKQSSLSTSTINKRLFGAKKRIRQVFEKMPESFDVLKRYQLEQELREIKGEKKQNRIIDKEKLLSPEEIKSLLDNSPQWLNLMIEFLIHTGVRISEMITIRQSWLKQENNYITIFIKGKGRGSKKERKLKVRLDLMNRIQSFYQGKDFLFETEEGTSYRREHISMRIKRMGKKLFNKNISAHTTRHSFATIMINKTGKIKAVSQYLGHSSTSITLDMYCHESLEVEELI